MKRVTASERVPVEVGRGVELAGHGRHGGEEDVDGDGGEGRDADEDGGRRRAFDAGGGWSGSHGGEWYAAGAFLTPCLPRAESTA